MEFGYCERFLGGSVLVFLGYKLGFWDFCGVGEVVDEFVIHVALASL